MFCDVCSHYACFTLLLLYYKGEHGYIEAEMEPDGNP